MTFDERVNEIKRAEDEFRDKLAGLIGPNIPIAGSDLFAVGAARRYLACPRASELLLRREISRRARDCFECR